MKVWIGGGSGFIGTALQQHLINQGYDLFVLVRSNKCALLPGVTPILWDQLSSFTGPSPDVVIQLAGENIGEGRWSRKKKGAILHSRIETTKALLKVVSTFARQPKLWINASAIGYYGDRPQGTCTESTPPGSDFLAHVCQEWERAASEAEKLNIRTVYARLGVVLSPSGGVLKKMLLPFKLGLGGVLGDGKQMMSWIALEDLVAIFTFIMQHQELRGPVNVVAPHPVTNETLTHWLGESLSRPTFFPIPAWLLRLIFGREKADALLLSSADIKPEKLQKAGYLFKYPKLAEMNLWNLQKE